jgi:TonB family protein
MQDGRKRTELTIVAPTEPDRAGDSLGAVVPLRDRETPKESPASDLSNVIPFARRKRARDEKAAPALALDPADRPAPGAATLERQRQITFLIVASVFVHGALFAAFNREPEAHASIGLISVTAEIVLGAQSNAGHSQTPSESDITSTAAPEPKQKPADEQPEAARKQTETQIPVEQPTEERQRTEPTPQRPDIVADAPQSKVAELIVEKKPVEKPQPEKKLREAARHPRDDGESRRTRSAPASAPSTSSNSIGRGRSDADTNYRGIVAAHLARHKQFPADARSRGQQGAATVTFSISGSGSVTAVRLARSSGVASIDQETQSMVRRASPFPAPPSGRAMSFTVPVSFYLR